MSEQFFINPYNFIPFGNSIEKKRGSREAAYSFGKPLQSGWLTVTLETRTPLIIPDGAHPRYRDEKNKCVENPTEEQRKKLHKEYSFLRIPAENPDDPDLPVIPGSELRGMLRSVYEAATDSCVPFLLDDKPLSQRVPIFGSLRKRGLLAYEKVNPDREERRWVLYSTRAERVEANVDKKNGKIRGIIEKNGDYVDGHGWLQYNIPVKTEKYHIAYLMPQKKIYVWDFIGENGKPDEKRNEEAYRNLKTALNRQTGRGGSSNEVPNKNLANALERAKNGEDNMVPVYYFTVKRGTETLVYLSNSSIGRIAQRRKWEEIMGVHAPCENTDRLCPACLLFGTVKGKGMKGHIRITDALPAMEDLRSESHTLQILGEPRTSAFEFYLRKPQKNQVTYWNFDFYGRSEQMPGEKRPHTEYYDLGEASPRGRKMYWHHMPGPDERSKNNMNATVEAVNGTFVFKVYFDQITEKQLQDLVWVITLGSNRENSTKQHKLGHAKPLGYGSVKLVITEKVVRKVALQGETVEVSLDRTDGDAIKTEPGRETDLQSEAMRNLLLICDTKAIPKATPITYPKATDKNGKEAIYTWFSANRTNPKSLQTLPEILDKDLTLRDSLKKSYPGKQEKWIGTRKDFHKSTDRKGYSDKRMKGRVKSFNVEKNFGYITGEDGVDYRVKINTPYNPKIQAEDLKNGREVSFLPKIMGESRMANDCEVI